MPPTTTITTTHLENYSTLVDTFLEFLTVAIHLILYERDIYPHRSFLKARKYNYPVRQNRHPAVCKFVDDAVAAVGVQVLKVCCCAPDFCFFGFHVLVYCWF